ncbi:MULTISPECIES: molecular chaperone HtpG [Caproicibacterium]|uniref:Chaperone protein HtpG n=1 Tax=Caproicibacterium lactatifermentans TaxID=2666138 RepID=A0A859DXN9_9FIRM|nr:molecular chaperone HtpG [Caproicibacterium lactatifermentans]ARP51297.1 molecular chaperone HtpG [Ruminococcaceae bacterium CPB6]MDD4807249.1 molecular chaperone HtpG [Oscillospiraceae bacterium]QKN24761.1 molecular chaperone HtpG [Caproicibacterium lactatifermentans]
MAMKQFKAESKRLLDLMINSIYTHKEIFMRELISNASDAIDKMYYRSLQENDTGLSRDDFKIHIALDKPGRKIIIEDNGCGMTKDDMEKDLGTIAKSGSLAFKQENKDKKNDNNIDIIGQFGVGFYAAFMVAKQVTVESKAYGSDEAWCWQSSGAEGYTVDPCEKAERGTKITLDLKDNTDDDNYDTYLDQYTIKNLIKKYSDYIRYPIRMDMQKSRQKPKPENAPKDYKPEYEDYTEVETLNSMVPLWRKNKNEVKPEEYNSFYKNKFGDYEDPLKVIHSYNEGVATYTALLFIPARASYDYYTRDYEKGLQLYSNGVLIMDKCSDLLPDCFSFVRGLVDSQDLSLNISRETLQHDHQLHIIEGRLEKKIKSELLNMLKNDREKYEQFYKAFGLQLKYGVYSDFGQHKELLQDLLLFYSSSEKKLVTLQEYVDRMKPDQKNIYYACGETTAKVDMLPQTEAVKDKGYEILYLTSPVDEFALRALMKYDDKEFKSVSDDDLDLQTEEEKAAAKKKVEENKDMLNFMKDALNGEVKEVILSTKLKSHPVCLSTNGALSMGMEKVLNQMPNNGGEKVKAQRVLEINANHPVFQKLTALYKLDQNTLKKYTKLLYTQALLIEGVQIEDPVSFSNDICDLMVKA